MGVAELNRAKFSGLDFDSHFDDLQSRMQIKFADDFNDFALSSLGIMLIDIISFGLDSLSFYLDRRTTDLYLETARTRKSVSRLTRQLGYKMRAAVSASADLDVSVVDPVAVSVPIPAGFQFQGPNDLVFEAAQEVEWSPAEQTAGTVKTVPVYQGQTFTESFVSDGTANQSFQLQRVPEESFVVAGSVIVTVDGSDWEESEFLTFDTTDQFEVGFNDEPPTLRFGDGVAGNIPLVNASIDVTYVASRGKEGLVNAGTITDVVAPLVVNFNSVNLSINNPRGSSGGDDPEDLTHAKLFAGDVYKSRFVAVTREDYEALAGSFADPLFGRVAVAQAFSSRSAESDLVLQSLLNDVRGAIAPTKPAVDLATAAITASLDTVDALLASLETNFTDIASKTTSIETDLNTAIVSARAVKNLSEEIIASNSSFSTLVTDGKTGIDGISVGAGPSELTSGDADALKALWDRITPVSTTIGGNASIIGTSVDSEIASMGTAKDAAEDIGYDVITAGSLLYTAEANRAAIVAEVGATGAPSTGIRLQVENIDTAVTDESTTVDGFLVEIDTHVDKILAADCKSNLVTVPILARDAGGFYTAPSISLISAVQDFLDTRKEVTQVVEVLSGEDFLIPAIIEFRVGVRTGFSESVTASEVETAVDGILRDRRFGVSLFTSDLVDVILLIEGVSFVNITVLGHIDPITSLTNSTRVDADGNLIIEDSEVITKGTITIITEPVVTTSSTV
jgi:hypothetical protein